MTSGRDNGARCMQLRARSCVRTAPASTQPRSRIARVQRATSSRLTELSTLQRELTRARHHARNDKMNLKKLKNTQPHSCQSSTATAHGRPLAGACREGSMLARRFVLSAVAAALNGLQQSCDHAEAETSLHAAAAAGDAPLVASHLLAGARDLERVAAA